MNLSNRVRPISKYLAKVQSLIFLLVLFQNCVPNQQKHDMVCVTRTGSKYHRCDCRYLAHSSDEITREEALKRNFTRCRICKPQKLEDKTDSEYGKLDDRQDKRYDLTEGMQCTALTKSGKRCKRKTTAGSEKCWQHR